MNPTVFAALSAFGAVVAAVSNAWAACVAPRPWGRIYAATAVFAVFYVGAWGWLVVHPHTDRQYWSEAMTPVALATFFVVWTAPAVASVIKHQKMKELTNDE